MSKLEETQKNEQKHDLTFEEICPEWSRRIANYDNLTKEQKLEISGLLISPSRCFLGEANDGKPNWSLNCSKCREFGGYIGQHAMCNEFTRAFINGKLNWKEFNRKKDAFVKHWNEKHVRK